MPPKPGASKPLIAVAVVLVLGIGAWSWLRTTRSQVAPAPVAEHAATPTEAPRRGPAGGDDRGAALAVLIDDDPRGELRLEGLVLGADDKPVAGTTVVLAANPPRTTTTGEDGTFTFEALVGRPYTLVARGAAGVAGPITARLTATSEPVVLHLRPAAKVTVAVKDPAGAPIDGATVELRGVDDQRATAAQGTATFATVVPGGYDLVAWAPGRAHTFQFAQVAAGDNALAITLVPGARVSGVVRDDGGAPVVGARVVYDGASDWSAQGDPRRDAVVTTEGGAFAFEALPPGSFRFTATDPTRAPGTSALVTLDGTTERTGIAITLAAGAAVRGRVVDASGQPVSSARVRVGEASRSLIGGAPRQAFSDDKGAFVITGLPRRALMAVAIHESASSANVTVDTSAGDVAELVIELVVTGTIAGVVVDPAGQPVEGAQVSAGPNWRDGRGTFDPTQWRLRGFPQELTDAGGRFTLTGLTPGSYIVNALPATAISRGRRGMGEGVTATTGDTSLRLVLQPEGGITGKVAFADGSAPSAYTVSVGMAGQPFTTDAFTLDSLTPQKSELTVRGPAFQSRTIEVVIEPGKITDVGTITVEKGRRVGGVVTSRGEPVAGATVYAGRMIFGSGSSSNAQMGPMGRGTKTAVTGADGTFALSGFGGGDVTIVAEEPALGRSKSLRLPAVMPGQTELTLELMPYGALSGVLRQGGAPAEGVFVTAQSTTTPGSLYNVASGPDGSYRFDKLAPDTYKVSATLGMPMMGMRFYSKQVDVPSGKEVTVDLSVEAGAVTLTVTGRPRAGVLGVANAWLASGVLAGTTAAALGLELAAAGPGASQWVIIRSGEPAVFKEVTPGAYTVCLVPFPAEVKGMAAMGYGERHGDELAAYCKAVTVGAAPASQAAEVAVDIPAVITDAPPGGAGSGSSTTAP